jgi:D-apionolactonase
MRPIQPKRAIKLFGTEVPEPKVRTLQAGALSAVFDNGALRYIKLGETEVLRAIAFLVRDENWGTFTPEISNLKLKQGKSDFRVTYDARCKDAKRSLTYRAEIACRADGALRFAATALPETDFLTNRTGFIVLHPLTGVACYPVEVEQVDGRKVKDKFPAIVNPIQPFFGIRALRHKVAPGIFATCRMEGDTFEMEDHRNWTDASFKTYVRPLAEPWPYTLPKGVDIKQSVSLTFSGKLPRPKAAGRAKPIAIALGRGGGTLPAIGVAVPEAEADAALANAQQIAAAAPRHLVCETDGRHSGLAGTLSVYQQLGKTTKADVVLEVILPGQQAPAAELAPIAAAIKDAKLTPAAIAISPAMDLRGVLPGSKGPAGPTLEEIYKAARGAFPGVRLGGGTFAFFTELNRKRPPTQLLDFVTHTTCPIVHAADDVSVMETLEALPYVTQAAKAFIDGKDYRVGPSSIPARLNPYGASTAPNPGNGRVCLSNMDPRQRGLFGAAWTLGYVAALASGGLSAITLGAATGPAGMIYRRTNYAQPYFDGVGGPAVYPIYHVIAGLAGASGSKLLQAKSAAPGKVAALAYRTNAGPVLWLANLTGETLTAKVAGFNGGALLHVLDEGTFVAATKGAGYLGKGGRKLKKVGAVELAPYAVARIMGA